MNRRRRPVNIWRILFLLVLVGAALYVNFVIVPVTPPLFIPTATPTRAPEAYVNDAEKLMNDGKFQPAIKAYQQAIQADPKNARSYIELSQLQVYTGNYQGAVQNAENALLINQNNATAHAIRGWALGFLGDYLPAETSIKKALELDPNSAIAHSYYAEILARQTDEGKGSLGSLDKAINESKQAQTLNPGLLETRRARGIILEMTGNYAEAAKEFEAAVAMSPNIADLHLALGRNYRYLEQYDKAVEEFNRANALNPSDPMPLTLISRTYATVGEFAKAIQFAEQAAKNDPSNALMYGNLGTMYYRNRQYSDAVPVLRLAIRGGKNEDGIDVKGLALDYGRIAEYYSTYGLALARSGECGEALQISQAMMNGVKNDEVAVYNASEMINICQQATTPGVRSTEKSGETKTTPKPTLKPTAKSTAPPAEGGG